MYRDVFDDFYRYMGTDIPKDDVFNIKVDIGKDPEGYEKLRQIAVDFFNNVTIYHYYVDDLSYVGLKDFDAAVDFFEHTTRIANNIGSKHIDLHSFNVNNVFMYLTAYEKPYDINDIGEISKLKRLSNGQSVFTLHELFDFFHFEYKSCLVYDDSSANTFESVIRAIFYSFDYNEEGYTTERSVVRNLIQLCNTRITHDLNSAIAYEEYKKCVLEATASGRGANSALRLIFRLTMIVVKWITAEKGSKNRVKAAESFIQYLQTLSKPVQEF